MPDTPPEHAPQHAAHLVLLAYQSGLIDRPAFDAVLDAWHADRARPIADLLAELGKVSPESLTFLDALARRHAQDLGSTHLALSALAANAGSSTVEELATRVPDLSGSLATRSPDDLFATRAPVSGGTASVGSSSAPGVRYRSIRLHAKGGLGAVFVAMDEELKRKVALKEIQAERADQRAARERFLVEAEITGKLEHPGIVPVYGLGTYADGRPFYAMRFIQGDSLETACLAFHSSPDPDPSVRSVALRGLLRRFLDVCNAVEYAHSRGILHRDLKPGNIMVGKYGETLVVDWGLARVMGHAGPGEPVDDHHGPIDPSTLSGSAQTVHGHAIGTPGFMSPEQAAGLHNELGQASDVYSLGATLYFVLTGRGPFSGSSSLAEVYEKARLGEFPAPRSLNPDIPRALDAICRKAMAVSPGDRYRSPHALADELEHFLADEPVDALPDTSFDRVLRWARRHRHATASAVATLAMVTLVASVASLLVDSARRSERLEKENTRLALQASMLSNARAEASLEAETKAKAEAEQNFKKAQKAVDDFLTAVSQSQELQLLPDTQAFRRKLLEKARSYYQDFLKEHAADGTLRVETGLATFRLANVVVEIGSKQEAAALFAESVRLMEPLVLAHPSTTDYRNRLATASLNHAKVLADIGRTAEAEGLYKRTLDSFDALVRANPGVADYRESMAMLLLNLANLQSATGRNDDAERSYARVVESYESLLRDHPKVAEYQNGLGSTWNNIGFLLGSTGRIRDASLAYGRAVVLYESLVKDHPRVGEYQDRLGTSLSNLALLQSAADHPQEAEQTTLRSIEIYEALVRDHPRVNDYRSHLAGAVGNLGLLRDNEGRKLEAVHAYTRAIQIFEDLARDNPSVLEYQDRLAGTLSNQALRLSAAGKHAEAERAFARSIEVFQTLARENPKAVNFQVGLGGTHVNLGHHFHRIRRVPESIAAYRNGLAPLTRALEADPRSTMPRRFLSNLHFGLASALRSSGRTTEAVETLQHCAALWPGKPNELYNIACQLSLCIPGGHSKEAEDVAIRAIGVLQAAVDVGWNLAEVTAHDPDLAPLRPRPDFQAILHGLQDRAFPADPFAK